MIQRYPKDSPSKEGPNNMPPFKTPQNKVLELEKLPTLPEIAYRLLDLLSREPEISELKEIIRHDQTLTAKILGVANSAYTHSSREISTLERAIVLLGLKEVSEIAFSICLFSLFKPLKGIAGFEPREFWLHSIATGVAAQLIAQALDVEDEESFFTLGLVHDIGRLVLLHLFPKEFELILEGQQKSGRPLLEEEKELGLAHTWMGRWLLKRWGLPEKFLEVARFHHHPFKKEQFLFEPGIVALADLAVHQLKMANVPGGQKGDPGPILQRLGLGEDLYQAVLEHLSLNKEALLATWRSLL